MTDEQKSRCVKLLVQISKDMRKNAKKRKLDKRVDKESVRYFEGVSWGFLDAAKILRDFM